MQKKYHGRRTIDGTIVTVNGLPLAPRHDLYNHSPDGFEWGYNGSGPAQLALALLADHLGNDELALAQYQAFKFAVVARWESDRWRLTSDEISKALQEISNHPLIESGPEPAQPGGPALDS